MDSAGTRLAAASDDATVRVWDVDSGQALAVLTGHDGGATRVAFSPDGERVLAVTDRSVRLWSLDPDASLDVLRGHTSYVYDIAFLDDQRILSGAWDRTLRVWNTHTRAEVAQWQPPGGIPYAVAYSPGGGPAGLIATAHEHRVSLGRPDLVGGPQRRLSAHLLSAMCFDAQRGAAVLCGGLWQDNDVWELRSIQLPAIHVGPTSQEIEAGHDATLFVIAQSGDPAVGAPGDGALLALSYQWRKDGVNLTNGQGISGATGPVLKIASASEADQGSYDVIVSHSCGSTTSEPATLTLQPACPADTNGNGAVDVDDLIAIILGWGACP